MRKQENPVLKELMRNFTLISQLGFSVIISILIFTAAFIYLDKKLNSGGNLIIVGVVLGVIMGILAAYRLVSKYFRR